MKKMLVLSTLSLALMSGAAYAQDGGTNHDVTTEQSVATEGNAEASSDFAEDVERAANEVGQAIENAANAVADEVNKSLNSGPNPDPNALGRDNASVDDDELDASATASISSSTQLGVTLDAIGADSDAFFTDGTRTTVVSDAEFAAAFGRLSVDQQAELRNSCQDAGSAGGAAADFCAAVARL